MIGLNIGSGQRRFTSTEEVKWVNVDSQSVSPDRVPDLVCDGSDLPYSDGYADFVVLHHVLEHFGCGEGAGLIREAHRVLKPEGSLLVFVPNMRALAVEWLNGKLSTQIYLTNVYGAYMGEEADRHKWGFDPQALSDFLWESANWSGMGPFDWRTLPGADIAQDWWISAAECVK